MNYFNPQPKKKNKYGAKKQSYAGRVYDSTLEVEASIKKPDSRVYEMISIKDLITKKLKSCT